MTGRLLTILTAAVICGLLNLVQHAEGCTDAVTMDKFIDLVIKIEAHPDTKKTLKDIANYLRLRAYSPLKWNVMVWDFPNPLPNGVLSTSELALLDKMLRHGTSGGKEQGVVLTTAKHAVALGRVITGICAGLEHNTDVKLEKWIKDAEGKIEYLHVATLAGDIAQSTIGFKTGAITALLGPGGKWDSVTCPKEYTLSGPASGATDAAIFGDLDGFIIGSVIKKYQARTKLSTILKNYYSTGLSIDSKIKDTDRVLQFKAIIVDKDMERQTTSISQAFLKKYSSQRGPLSAADMPLLVQKSIVEFYNYKFMKECSFVTEDYSVDHFIKLVKKIEGTGAKLQKATNYVRGVSKQLSNSHFNSMLGDSEALPSGVLSTIEKRVLLRMLSHQFDGNREIGVIRDPGGKSIATSHLISGIAAGLNRKKKYQPYWFGPEMDNLYAATIAGDIGQSAMEENLGRSKAIFGPKGKWNNETCPLRFTVKARDHKTEATHAEVHGDLDGFNIGEKIPAFLASRPSLRLSTLLTEYYSCSGVEKDTKFSYRARDATFNAVSSRRKLIEESTQFSIAFKKQNFLSTSNSLYWNIDADDLPGMMSTAVGEFYKTFISTTPTGDNTCHGNMLKLRPTGAKLATAKQDGLNYEGVKASKKMAETDWSEVEKKLKCFVEIGTKYCLPPSLIAALASRESRVGKLLKSKDGWGDCRSSGCRAYGILQCDIFSSGLGRQGCTKYSWDSCEHMDMMIETIFLEKLRRVKGKLPCWLKEQQLQGAVAAYNFGVKNVQTWERLDIGTSHHDYSNDVIARAQYFHSKMKSGSQAYIRTKGCKSLSDKEDCTFYPCMNSRLPCGAKGFALWYGERICDSIKNNANAFDAEGKKWLTSFNKCMMDQILGVYNNPQATCPTIKAFGLQAIRICHRKTHKAFWAIAEKNAGAFVKMLEVANSLGEDRDYMWHQMLGLMRAGYCPTAAPSIVVDSAVASLKSKLSYTLTTATSGVESACTTYAQQGDCRFYECMAKRFPCPSFNHIKDFEYISCKEFSKNRLLFNPSGWAWWTSSQKCLMSSLLTLYKAPSIKCSHLHSIVFEKRQECWLANNFCGIIDDNAFAIGQSNQAQGFPLIIQPRTVSTSILKDSVSVKSYFYHNVFEMNNQIGNVKCRCRQQKRCQEANYQMIHSKTLNTKMKLVNRMDKCK